MSYTYTYNKDNKKIYCANCGKIGHLYKRCTEPIISFGIITIKIENEELNYEFDLNEFINKYTISDDNTQKYFNILKSNNKNLNSLNYIEKFKKNIKFLMIQRKHTLGYIEFIRGRYEINKVDSLILLFEQMTKLEIEKIEKNNFDNLWNELWKNNISNKIYDNEYQISKKKFIELKESDNILLKLSFYTKNVVPKYDTPEWGFPKGRRNYLEKNLECAEREFMEETDLNQDEFNVLTRIYPLNEIFKGTNNILYKHTYYIGVSDNKIESTINKNNDIQIEEIGDVQWFSYTEAFDHIRSYHHERKKILNELFLFIVYHIINNNDETTI